MLRYLTAGESHGQALVAVLVLRAGRKSQLPFGPWLAAGALLAVLAAAPLPPS